MNKTAVGFYWTLPVPWVGFTSLSKSIDVAAERSLTIRYQRDIVRNFAKRENFRIIHEEVLLEIEPDRGSQEALGTLDKVAGICRSVQATLLYVDFSQVQRWRSHGPMREWAEKAAISIRQLDPDEIEIDGKPFNPHHHFERWRSKQIEWSASKEGRKEKALRRAFALREAGRTYEEVSQVLNEEGIKSPSGKLWKANNVKKFVQGASARTEEA